MGSRVRRVMLDRKEVGNTIRAEVRRVFGDEGLKFRQISNSNDFLNIEVYASPEDRFPGLIIQSHNLRSEDGPNLGHVELYAPGLCELAMRLRSDLSSRMGKLYLLGCSQRERKNKCSGCYPFYVGKYPD